MKSLALAFLVLGLSFAKDARAAGPTDPEVVIETSLGKFTVRLFQEKAPGTVKNFLEYATSGYYENTVFHRIIPGFMIQGGGYTQDLAPKSGLRAPIKNEASNGLSNKRGTLAMARTGAVDSATSQFFVNVKDNTRLDHTSSDPMGFGYCVFGEVIAGMDVVDKIKAVETKCPSDGSAPCMEQLPPGMRDVPKTPVVIKKITRK